MKFVRLFFFALSLCALAGCAVSEETPTDVGRKLEEGLQGRGKIVPNNPTSDNFGPNYQ